MQIYPDPDTIWDSTAFRANEHDNTSMEPQAKRQRFSKLSTRCRSLWREMIQIIQEMEYFVNHPFNDLHRRPHILHRKPLFLISQAWEHAQTADEIT